MASLRCLRIDNSLSTGAVAGEVEQNVNLATRATVPRADLHGSILSERRFGVNRDERPLRPWLAHRVSDEVFEVLIRDEVFEVLIRDFHS